MPDPLGMETCAAVASPQAAAAPFFIFDEAELVTDLPAFGDVFALFHEPLNSPEAQQDHE